MAIHAPRVGNGFFVPSPLAKVKLETNKAIKNNTNLMCLRSVSANVGSRIGVEGVLNG